MNVESQLELQVETKDLNKKYEEKRNATSCSLCVACRVHNRETIPRYHSYLNSKYHEMLNVNQIN